MLQNPKRLQSTTLSILCSLYPSRLLQCPESFHQIIHITINEPRRGFRWLCHLKVDLHSMPSDVVGISINTRRSVKTAKLLCNSLSKVLSHKFVFIGCDITSVADLKNNCQMQLNVYISPSSNYCLNKLVTMLVNGS
jgi:hypothetical protein